MCYLIATCLEKKLTIRRLFVQLLFIRVRLYSTCGRKSGQKEVENVEEMILQFDGEEVRFADACGENFMAHKEE